MRRAGLLDELDDRAYRPGRPDRPTLHDPLGLILLLLVSLLPIVLVLCDLLQQLHDLLDHLVLLRHLPGDVGGRVLLVVGKGRVDDGDGLDDTGVVLAWGGVPYDPHSWSVDGEQVEDAT